MTYDELVMRVAKALVRHSWKGSSLVDGEELAESGDFDPKYLEEAKVAIAAIRKADKDAAVQFSAWCHELAKKPLPDALTRAYGDYKKLGIT